MGNRGRPTGQERNAVRDVTPTRRKNVRSELVDSRTVGRREIRRNGLIEKSLALLSESTMSDPTLGPIVLIALTGYGTAEDKARSRAAGFDHHLVKPVNVQALRAVVDGVTTA